MLAEAPNASHRNVRTYLVTVPVGTKYWLRIRLRQASKNLKKISGTAASKKIVITILCQESVFKECEGIFDD
eukprot:scaffold470_cov98-Cylindrotheca_fusiformis.AAC.1